MTRVGITCDFETITGRRGQPESRFVSPCSYAAAVDRVGGMPLLLPYVAPQHATEILDAINAVVISGGNFDVPPEYYGETARQCLGGTNPERSACERALLAGALARDMPVLAVCGGMQLLNVISGGSLFQDRSDRPNTDEHEQPDDKTHPYHGVKIVAGTLLARTCDAASLRVNSTHHQMVRDIGDGLVVTATATDGVIEAIESPAHSFVIGVQWHPELLATDEQLALYSALVAAAR